MKEWVEEWLREAFVIIPSAIALAFIGALIQQNFNVHHIYITAPGVIFILYLAKRAKSKRKKK